MNDQATSDIRRQSIRIATLLALFSIEQDYSKQYKSLRETANVLIDGLVLDLEREQLLSREPIPQSYYSGMSNI